MPYLSVLQYPYLKHHISDIAEVYAFYFQRDATLHNLFISGKLLYMFRVVSPPIIRSTHNCIYSIWYLLLVTATSLYCGRVGAGLSVVWELYRSVLVRPLTYVRHDASQCKILGPHRDMGCKTVFNL